MAQGALLLPRRYKTGGFPQVNLAHPMAKHLAAFYVPTRNISGAPAFWNALTQTPGPALTGCTYIETTEGAAIRFPGTQAVASTTAGIRGNTARFTNSWTDNRICTVIARARLNAAPASNASVFSVTSSGAGAYAAKGGAWVGFNLSGNAGGGCITGNGVIFGGDTKNWSTNREWVSLGGSYHQTDLGTWGGTGTPWGWVNGVRYVGSASGGATNSHQTPQVAFGKDPFGYAASFNGDMAWGAAFLAYLSNEEHAWWARNALEVLEQTRNYSFFSFPEKAGGATFTPQSNRAILQAVNRASTF